jgi:hypothetical protein
VRSKYTYPYESSSDKLFDKTKDEVALLIRLFDRAYFSGLKKSSSSRDYIKKKNKERNKLDFNNN